MATSGKIHSVSIKTLPSYARMIDNVTMMYISGINAGIDTQWYSAANSIACDTTLEYGLPLESSVGVIAALSPSLSWDKNILEANRLIAYYLQWGFAPNSCIAYPANVRKAECIIDGQSPDNVLGGNKVKSFYRNILQPGLDNVVTIDRHAIAIAMLGLDSLGNETTSLVPTDKTYALVSSVYCNVAKRYGVVANVIQSVSWVLLTSSQTKRGK